MATEKRAWLLPNMTALVFGLVFGGALLLGPVMMNLDGDLGRHITIGRTILEQGRVPLTDIYSHTRAGAFMVPHEWVAQVLFALAERLLGAHGVVVLTALVLASTYALLMWGLRQHVHAPLALLAVMLAALAGSIHWLTRPHIFTILFFVAFLIVLERYRAEAHWRRLLPLLPLTLLWANVHGAFVVGLVLMALYAIAAVLAGEWRSGVTLVAAIPLLIGISAINPAGFYLIANSFDYLGESWLVAMTVEYRSPDFHQMSTWPFAAILLGTIAVLGLSKRRLNWTAIAVLGVWGAFALHSARNIPLYSVAAVWFLALEADHLLADYTPRLRDTWLHNMDAIDKRAWGWMWVAGLVAVGIWVADVGGFSPAVFPVEALDTLGDERPEGEVFNEFAWGGYMLYRLWPDERVFIDGQTDFYGEELSRDYDHIINGRAGWQGMLTTYGVDWIIIPLQRPLAERLNEDAEWVIIYTDDLTGVWVRR